MLLTCPNCSASFRLPPGSLGGEGREVRCSQCKFHWYASPRDLVMEHGDDAPLAPPPPMPKIIPAAEPAAPPPPPVVERAPEPEPLPEPEPEPELKPEIKEAPLVETVTTAAPVEQKAEEAPVEAAPAAAAEEATPVEPATEAPASVEPEIDLSALDQMLAQGEESKKKAAGADGNAKGASWVLGVAAAAVLLLFIGSCLLALREPLLRTIPALEMLYSMVSMPTSHGLKLSSLTVGKVPLGEKARYAIGGSVVNTSKKERAIPTVRIRMMADDGTMLRFWEFSQPGRLKPGERKAFNAAKLDGIEGGKEASFIVDLGNSLELMLRK